MKKIGLIALDLDGTLLDDEKSLPEANRQALVRCAEMGIHIVPTTGRSADGIPQMVRELPGVNYAITTNGGVVVDLKNKKNLKRCVLSNEKTLELLEIISQYHVMYDPYVDGRGITQPQFIDHMKEYGLKKELQKLVRETRDVVPNIMGYLKESKKEAEKVNIYLADVKDRELLRRELKKVPGIIISSSMYNNLEINAEGATKGEALLWLADYLHVDREGTLAFGDGENDVSMLQMAGIGVAMGNAEEQIRRAADQVTLTNVQNGVADAICRIVFGNLEI